jgi:hypothetical protein
MITLWNVRRNALKLTIILTGYYVGSSSRSTKSSMPSLTEMRKPSGGGAVPTIMSTKPFSSWRERKKHSFMLRRSVEDGSGRVEGCVCQSPT